MYNLDGKIAIVTGAGSKSDLGRAIALRLAKEGVGVAVVDKDIIHSCENDKKTELHSEEFKIIAGQKKMSIEEVSRQKHEAVKARGLGVSEDIAKMVAFLCSNEAGFITGQAINVNGGIFTAA